MKTQAAAREESKQIESKYGMMYGSISPHGNFLMVTTIRPFTQTKLNYQLMIEEALKYARTSGLEKLVISVEKDAYHSAPNPASATNTAVVDACNDYVAKGRATANSIVDQHLIMYQINI